MQILTDRTDTIRASVKDVEFELMLTIGLVVMVIFLFLRNFSATIIPSVAVPLSIVGTFGVMYLLGYSLNNLTLMALTISTGFVVDDAIVMIENIDRFLEAGDSPLDAALKGAGQIGFTIVSLTVSLIAVLIPLLFMGDIVGRLFREFAVTLAVTILVSAVVSLTLTPMMSAKLLKHRKPGEQGRFYEVTEDYYNRVIAFYGRTVKWVLKHQTTTLLVTAGDAGADAVSVRHRAQGIFPGAGYGRDSGHFGSAGRRFVQCDGAAAAGTGEGHSARSGCREPVVVHRRGRHQHYAEQRPHSDQPEAARSAERRCARRSSAGCSRKLAKVEGITLYMQPVQDLDGGRPGQPHAISVLDGRCGRAGTGAMDAEAGGEAADACRNCAMWPATS